MMTDTPCFDWATCPDCDGLGSDENANFYCSACRGEGSIPAHRSCYEVVSPEMVTYFDSWDPPEPPEYGCAFGVFVAATRRAALIAAVKDPEFAEWVSEARGDSVPPFKGLKVQLARCPHGVCWNCNGSEDSSGCSECDAASDTAIEQTACLTKEPA